MKKILSTLALVGLVATSSFANDTKGLYLGGFAGSVTFGDSDATEYGFSYGYTKEFQNNVTFGFENSFFADSFDSENQNTSKSTIYGMDINLQIGYKYKGFHAYALGGAILLDSFYGFEYGGAAEYFITDSFRIGADFKQSSLTDSYGVSDIDYTKYTGFLRYTF